MAHQLEPLETKVVRFVICEHPKATHLSHCAQRAQQKAPMTTPKLALETIHPRSWGGFEKAVRAEVAGACAAQERAKAAGQALLRQLPASDQGKCRVSFMQDLDINAVCNIFQ